MNRERLLERFLRYVQVDTMSCEDSAEYPSSPGQLTLGKMLRDELIENVQRYLNHEEQEIASLAHLSVMAIPGYEFINSPSLELLKQLEQRIEEHHEEIMKSTSCTQKLAELIILIYLAKSMRNATREFAEREIERFKDDTSDDGRFLYRQLRDQLYFGRLDLPTIVDRVSSKQPRVDADVYEFFAELEKYPNGSLEVHQCALDVIREYIRQERKQMAQQLLQKMDQNVIPAMVDEGNKQKVREAMEEFKPFL